MKNAMFRAIAHGAQKAALLAVRRQSRAVSNAGFAAVRHGTAVVCEGFLSQEPCSSASVLEFATASLAARSTK